MPSYLFSLVTHGTVISHHLKGNIFFFFKIILECQKKRKKTPLCTYSQYISPCIHQGGEQRADGTGSVARGSGAHRSDSSHSEGCSAAEHPGSFGVVCDFAVMPCGARWNNLTDNKMLLLLRCQHKSYKCCAPLAGALVPS